MLLTVDRTEENIAVLIDAEQKTYEFPLSYFPSPPREGDIFELSYSGGSPVLTPKPELAAERHEKIKSRFSRLFKRK